MIKGFIVIIGLLLVGDAISQGLSLPIPGSVIGMVALLWILIWRGGIDEDVALVSDGLVKHIGLLFVPAGAGISLYLGMLAENWLVILVASLTSTALSLIAVGILFKFLSKGEPQ